MKNHSITSIVNVLSTLNKFICLSVKKHIEKQQYEEIFMHFFCLKNIFVWRTLDFIDFKWNKNLASRAHLALLTFNMVLII